MSHSLATANSCTPPLDYVQNQSEDLPSTIIGLLVLIVQSVAKGFLDTRRRMVQRAI